MAFVKICSVKDISKGQGKEFSVQGKAVAVFNVDDEFYCIDAKCNHAGGPLAEGDLDGCQVTCPWHGACFDVRNGKDLSPPASGPIPSHKVKVEGENVMVEL